ncbi:hypothetical protein CR513_46042, partial [Mucuna pruriens]
MYSKKNLEEFKVECFVVVLKKLPPKLKDPRCFTISCTMGNTHFEKVLCDLGASINLMPYSISKKFGLQEPQPTTISLQLANRTITHPLGIANNVLVKV